MSAGQFAHSPDPSDHARAVDWGSQGILSQVFYVKLEQNYEQYTITM